MRHQHRRSSLRCAERPLCRFTLILGASGLYGSAHDLAHAEDVSTSTQSITNGSADQDDPSVVALLANGKVHCSGVLVRPRIVLTAAHCLTGNQLDAVLFEPSTGNRRSARVQRAWRHPGYMIGQAEHDLGLVLLPASEHFPFLPISTEPVTLDDLGSEVRIVGYGRTSVGDAGALEKRAGTAIMASVSSGTFTLRAAPSLACGGDSGGPALRSLTRGAIVIGIISQGDDACVQQTQVSSIDANARTFIESLISQIESHSGDSGSRCIEGSNCTSGFCLSPEDAPDFGYCSSHCFSDVQCSVAMRCATGASGSGTCVLPRPSPGAIGAPCSSESDCQFAMCSSFPHQPQRICSSLCFPDDAESCPVQHVCAEVAGASQVWGCMPGPNGVTSGSGGCAIGMSGSGRGVDLHGAAPVVLVAIILGRRRSRPSPP
jgi:hypothetical protein